MPSGRLFGTAVRPDQFNGDLALIEAIKADCQLLVPEYHGQWSAVEWRRGDPWYGNYDAITAFARSNGMQVRGHSLIWEQMTPDWAREEMVRDRDWATVERHFATLLPRYRGQIADWIVVNEMIDTESGHHNMRQTSFQRAYGNDYVRRALESARALDPDARLIINDYSLEHDNPVDEARRHALLRLVESLKRSGTPLDMVGIQGHLELRKGAINQRKFERFLTELSAMGVGLSITELDVLEDDRNMSIEQRDQNVASMAQDLLDVAMDQPALHSVVTWALSDRHSWLQDRADTTKAALACSPVDCVGLNRGLPYDANYAPKPFLSCVKTAMANGQIV